MNPVELAAAMLRHPLAQRYIAHTQATGDNKIRTPEDVLGERLVRLATLVLVEHEKPRWMITPWEGDPMTQIVALALGAVKATPYLWTEEVRYALRGLETPRHVLSPRGLPEPNMWHTFHTGIYLGGELTHNGQTFIDGIADAMHVMDGQKGISMFVLGEMKEASTGNPRPCITGGGFAYGKVFPDEFSERERLALEGALLMNGFLNSPFIPKHRERLSRAARRECNRLNEEMEDDHITFVVLRRPETSRKPADDETSVNWKHRWLVRGHMRAQWYPSESAHRLIWIAPHLKGPDDAPMLEHAYKVAR